MKINEKLILIIKLLAVVFISADLILNIIILVQNKSIKKALRFLDYDISSIERTVDNTQDDISKLDDKLSYIESDISNIESSLY